MNVILGAGLAGLSTSYHLGHENCLLIERKTNPYGHVHSQMRDGFTWDEGPHVSFTRNEYVRELFTRNVKREFDELSIQAKNYYQGHWINHPAQSNFHQIPEPLRGQCLQSFLEGRAAPKTEGFQPANYREWLDAAYGKVFAEIFPAVYTQKYWTVAAESLGTDWIGPRMFLPKVEDVVQGAKGPLDKQTYYITQARYPQRGGYQSFVRELAEGAQIEFGKNIESIDLREKKIICSEGKTIHYRQLINTLPLPVFIRLCVQAGKEVQAAAARLKCSQLLLVNVTAPHPTVHDGNWFYIYDREKLSTRINCTERLSKNNAPAGQTGVQTEVYFPHGTNSVNTADIAGKVVAELLEMKFIEPSARDKIQTHTVWVPWANVIFDHERCAALNFVLSWLEQFGLIRESEDLNPAEQWEHPAALDQNATLFLAGRFGQWKYFWTDDCVLRGAKIAGKL